MPGFPFGFMPDPEDPNVQAALLRQKQAEEDMQIKNLEWKDNFAKFLKGLPQDEVEVLSNVFYHLTRQPAAAQFYLGLVHAVGTLKYDTCPMCAEDHAAEIHNRFDEGLKKLTGEGEPAYQSGTFVVPPGSDEGRLETTVDQMAGEQKLPLVFMKDEFKQAEEEVRALNYDFRMPTTAQMAAIMTLANEAPPRPLPQHMEEMALQYGVEDAWEQPADGEEVVKFVGWQCNNCGMMYPSLQDRMLKEPGLAGCTGCVQKTKWG